MTGNLSDDDARTYADLHAVKLTTHPYGYDRQMPGGLTAHVSATGDVTLSNGLATVTIFAEHANHFAGLFTGVAITQQPNQDWPAEVAKLVAVTRSTLDRRGGAAR
jgi:hypothetical protein